jgi:hypothetical protein
MSSRSFNIRREERRTSSRGPRRPRVGTIACMALLTTIFLPSSRAQKESSPAIKVSFPNYSYPEPVASLQQFDFRNSEVLIFSEAGSPFLRAQLRRGRFEKARTIGGDSVEYKWTKFSGKDPAGPHYAIAFYTWTSWAASANDAGVIQLLRLENGHLHVVQQILFNIRGSQKAGAHFSTKSNSLTVRGLNEWEHCCPSGLDVVQFQLKDDVLKQVHYGKIPVE